jgi:hypothetical protein
VVVGYDDPYKAEEVRLKLRKLQSEHLLDLEDAVVAVKDERGKVKLHQAVNLSADGAVSGGFCGSLTGLIFLDNEHSDARQMNDSGSSLVPAIRASSQASVIQLKAQGELRGSCERNFLAGQGVVHSDRKIASQLSPLLVAIRPNSKLKGYRTRAEVDDVD